MGQKSDRLNNIDHTGPAAEDQEEAIRRNSEDLPNGPDAATVLKEILVVDENAVGVSAADGAEDNGGYIGTETTVYDTGTTAGYGSDASNADETDDTAEIRAGIEQTRTDISETINAIQEKLGPGTLVENIKGQVRDQVHEQVQHAKDAAKEAAVGKVHDVKEAAVDKAHDVIDGAKSAVQHAAQAVRNAAGSAMGAVGAATHTAVDATEQAFEGTAYKAEEVLHSAGEKVHSAQETITEATRPAVAAVGDFAGRVGHTARGAGLTMKQTSTSLVDTIKGNPVPAAMVAIGLGWLAMQGKRPHSDVEESGFKAWSDDIEARGLDAGTNGTNRDYNGNGGAGVATHIGAVAGDTLGTARDAVGGAVDTARDAVGGAVDTARDALGGAVEGAKDTVGGALEGARDTVGGAVGTARESVGSAVEGARDTVGHLAGQTREHASHAAEMVRERAHQSQDVFQQKLQQNPLAIGAVAVALGAAIGLAIPGTRREQELMGETRDHLLQQGQAAAKDTFAKVQHVAEQVVGHVVDEAKTVAADAKTLAAVAAEEEGLTPKKSDNNDISSSDSNSSSE